MDKDIGVLVSFMYTASVHKHSVFSLPQGQLPEVKSSKEDIL